MAIVGPSGCGKTTLLKILLGLLEPTDGDVLIDAVPIRKVGYKRYRELIGAVMQEDQLFAGSIAENISFFDPKFDIAKVETSAVIASVVHDIQLMPMGFQTAIGDMGSSLSGGQKQRILLARALYREPRILFLDEATSHLDMATEAAVNAAVNMLNTTRIIVAHRPDTIAMADRVYILS